MSIMLGASRTGWLQLPCPGPLPDPLLHCAQGLAETLCGSPLYMAPEILKYLKYDCKADLWSTGVILYELVVGRTPFNGINHLQLVNEIDRKQVLVPPDIMPELSTHLVELIFAVSPASLTPCCTALHCMCCLVGRVCSSCLLSVSSA